MPAVLISEIFDEINNYKDDEHTRNTVVNKHKDNKGFATIAKAIYDPRIQWYRKEVPKYTPCEYPIGLAPSNLYMELKRMYLFMKGYGDHVPDEKKDFLLTTLLEVIHISEAKLVEQMFRKKSDYDWFTEEFVRNTWPDILPAVTEETNEQKSKTKSKPTF